MGNGGSRGRTRATKAAVVATFNPHLGSQAEQRDAASRLAHLLDTANEREDSGETKARITHDLTRRLAGNEAFARLAAAISPQSADTTKQAVSALIHAWHYGSLNGKPVSEAFNLAAAREFKLQNVQPLSERAVQTAQAAWGAHLDGFQALTRAMYDNTQAWFHAHGVTEVPLYRGMGWQAGHEPHTINWEQPPASTSFRLSALSSFSVKEEVARGDFTGHDYVMLLSARVPVQAILSTAQTGIGTKNEGEMVVLGGNHTFSLDTMTPKDFEDFSSE